MTVNHLCILGLGYIGFPTACLFADRGIQITGVDTNINIINSLRNGIVHIIEPGLNELASGILSNGCLVMNEKPVEADAFIIAVPTPFFDGKKADMRYVQSAAESIVPVLKKGNLVVLESTSPPLTTVNIVKPILEKSGLIAGEDFSLAYSPERVLPGQILSELVNNARVVGGINYQSALACSNLYRTFVTGEIVITDSTTAEMVKLMENTYRDINIAIANEFSRLANYFQINVWEAIKISNLHPRVNILSPGIGVGGHCISVDPWFLVEAAPSLTPLITTAREVNDSQPEFAIGFIEEILKNLHGKRITLLGLAYKPDVDDLRESPAVEIALSLTSRGAIVTAFEPMKPAFELPNVQMASTIEEALSNSECIILLVPHKQFRELSPKHLRSMTTAKIVIDTTNIWQPDLIRSQDFSYHLLGNGKRVSNKVV